LFKLAVLISGNGTNLQALIDANKNEKWEIWLVVSDNPNAFGLKRAEAANIKTMYISKHDPGILLETLRKNRIDGIVLAGYLSILPRKIVSAYKGKIINIHPSLIPDFCGKGFYGEKVHSAVLESGVKITGATVHYVDEGIDTGPIIMQKSVSVFKDDNVESLQKRVLQAEHEILLKAVRMMAGDSAGKDMIVNETKSVNQCKRQAGNCRVC